MTQTFVLEGDFYVQYKTANPSLQWNSDLGSIATNIDPPVYQVCAYVHVLKQTRTRTHKNMRTQTETH